MPVSRFSRWGQWATLGLGLIASLVGQLAALTAVIWWCGLDLLHLTNITSERRRGDLVICISTPV